MNTPTQFVERLLNPFWSPPDKWAWSRSDYSLETQGINTLQERPGVFNLAWLAMDLEAPPAKYNMRDNPLLLWVLLNAGRVKCGNTTLEAYASTHSLRQFSENTSTHEQIIDLIRIARKKVKGMHHDA